MLKLAWFSPLSKNIKSKSANFTAALEPYLEKNYAIDYFVDDETVDNKKVFHYLRALQLHRQKNYDCFVYQLEDQPGIAFIQRHQALFPGLTIFHDLNLNNLYFQKHQYSSAATVFNIEMDNLFGPTSARLGDYLIKNWPLGIFDGIYIRSRQEIENSSFAIVQNEAQAEFFNKHNTCAVEIFSTNLSAFADKRFSPAEKEKVRDDLGFTKEDFIISFSESTELKDRLPQLLEALAEKPKDNLVLLCIAKNKKDYLSYKSLLAKENNLRFKINETKSDLDFMLQHLAADLHFAVTNDLLRAMPLAAGFCFAKGVPLITSSLAWAKELPEGSCFKIKLGNSEVLEVQAIINELFINRELLFQLSENAQKYANDFWRVQLVFQNLQRVIERNSFKLKNLSQEKMLKYSNYKNKIITENSLNE